MITQGIILSKEAIGKRITPELITKRDGNIFVFGSNESGLHGAGAARTALNEFGATIGMGYGLSGESFAIPTKDWYLKTLSVEQIKFYVDGFIRFVKNPAYRNTGQKFNVTAIGCGIAGYDAKSIAPLFRDLMYDPKINLPLSFWEVLLSNT